jgi:hypothetical protein
MSSCSDDSSVEDYVLSDVEMIRQALRETTLNINWGEDNDVIFANIDSFLELSEGNNTVQRVTFDQFLWGVQQKGAANDGRLGQAGKGYRESSGAQGTQDCEHSGFR